jgi:hypothetical protein
MRSIGPGKKKAARKAMSMFGKSIVGSGLAAMALVAVTLGGCGGDLPVASQLERTRVLGARVQVPGEPGRASVQPGEAANVEWLIAGPVPPATLEWAFALCSGNSSCADSPQPLGTGSGAPVVVPFTTPDAAALTDGKLPLMLGVVCGDGVLSADAASPVPACTGAGASNTLTQFAIPVTPEGETANVHPNLGNDVLELDGTTWDAATAAAVAGDPCDANSGLSVVQARPVGGDEDAARKKIRLISDGDDRETFAPPDGAPVRLEELQFSNFATSGKFEASYGAIFATDPRPDADVTMKWIPPETTDVAAGGQVVKLYFVVRDLRGGLDFTTRGLCLLP